MNENALLELFSRYAQTKDRRARDELVASYLPLSRAVARRFAGQGIEMEDLEQVAAMALTQALDRFDPARGVKFSTFALPTIAGTLRNYLRDRGGAIRVSRDVRSRLGQLAEVTARLTQTLRREPSLRELALEMDCPPEELLTLLEARQNLGVMSLDAPIGNEDEELRLLESLGSADSNIDAVEGREWMAWVMKQVSPPERVLITKRYIEHLGQRDTAKAMGVSQMQVSRMERRLLTRLRTEMTSAGV